MLIHHYANSKCLVGINYKDNCLPVNIYLMSYIRYKIDRQTIFIYDIKYVNNWRVCHGLHTRLLEIKFLG
jgi:hypothetical protein